MNDREPNKIIKAIAKRLKKLSADCGGLSDKYDWKEHEKIKKEFEDIVTTEGAIEVMSKNALITVVKLQGTLRAMPEHRFYQPFARAYEDLKL